jgi:hypothetical protein
MHWLNSQISEFDRPPYVQVAPDYPVGVPLHFWSTRKIYSVLMNPIIMAVLLVLCFQIPSLQNTNCSNETALWRSMLAGSPTVATELLHRGADPTPHAILSISKGYRLSRTFEIDVSRSWKMAVFGISAILAPLLQDSSPYVRHTAVYVGSKFDFNEAPYPFDVHLLNKVFSCAVSPVVDNTAVSDCFPPSVLVEIENIICGETHFAFHSHSSAVEPQDMVKLLFGSLRAGLQQLCVRRIIDHVFFTQPPRK